MTTADKKIVKDNPGMTPYDLMTTKGLSETAFNELVAAEDADAQNKLKANPAPEVKPRGATKPTNVLKASITPHIENLPHMQQGGSRSDKVRVVPISGGSGTEMSRVHAESLVRKNPTKYRING